MPLRTIPKRVAKLAHVSLRTEKHGEENVKAADLKVSFTTSNDWLNELAPGLAEAHYKAAEQTPETAAELFEPTAPLPLTVRRFPEQEGFRWTLALTAMRVTIAYGIRDDGAIVLDGSTVDKFSIETMEGGSIIVTYRVKCHPDAEQIAKLYELLDSEIDIEVEMGNDWRPAQASLVPETEGAEA